MADREQERLERARRNLRTELGWGASMGASPEEKAAFETARLEPEIQAGRASISQLPEQYGGRPTGQSRRAIRMQQAWDAQQAQALQQQQAMRQQAEFEKTMMLRDLDIQTKEYDFELRRTSDAADLQDKKIIQEQAITARDILGQYPDTPEGIAAATYEINKVAPRAWEDPVIGKVYHYKEKNASAIGSSIKLQLEEQDADAKEQAQLKADVVTYGITPEQQAAMLEPNLPAGVVRFDPLKAMPIIAAAKQTQEAAKETKAEEKETKKGMASKEDEYQKAFAEYRGLVAEGTKVDPEVVAKAKAKARAAAAVLGLPKVKSEKDLKNYKSGDRVLAPNGITVITIP